MAFPVDNTKFNLTGKFGWRAPFRLPNGQMTRSFHGGLDLAPEVKGSKEKTYAVKAGTVTYVGARADAGRNVIVHIPQWGVWVRYCHLDSYRVRKGDKVQEAQWIGNVGTTGNSTGVHLHFEVYTDAGLTNRVDPHRYIWFEKNPVTFAINSGKPAPAPKPTPAPKPSGKSAGGANVRELQSWLNKSFPAYSKLSVNGSYDAKTQAVISEFQRRIQGTKWNTGKPDGNIGPLTKKALQGHGFNSWGAAPKPAPKPAGPIGKQLKLAGRWGKFNTASAAKNLRAGTQSGWFQAGTYKVTNFSQGQYHIEGNGNRGWINSAAKAGLQ